MADKIKHTVKDSIFTCLFRDPKNLLDLYRTLHPEDTAVTEKDCKLFNLNFVLINGIFNDLGMLVRDRMILLLEAQSTFTKNIALRILMYLAESYKDYIDRQDHRNLYSPKEIKIPRPELYMVYVGPRKTVPERIRLSELYKDGGEDSRERGWLDLEVRVLRGTGKRDILDQYIRYCEIQDEQRKKYGRTPEVMETVIEKCLEEGVLSELLTSRRKEVRTIMRQLYDYDTILENYAYEVEQRGIEKGIRVLVDAFRGNSQSRDAVIQTVAKGYGLSEQAAAEKVAQYWT